MLQVANGSGRKRRFVLERSGMAFGESGILKEIGTYEKRKTWLRCSVMASGPKRSKNLASSTGMIQP
jgi:hypothetical protein